MSFKKYFFMFNNILNYLKSLVSLKKKKSTIFIFDKNNNILNSMKLNISIRTYIYSMGKLISKIKVIENSYNHMWLLYYI